MRVETFGPHAFLRVEREALRLLAEQAMSDINHLLRPAHLAQLAKILDDPEATGNDKFVAFDLLSPLIFVKNANIAAGGILPMCQDTGTAIVMGKKGRFVFTGGDDESALAEGIRNAYERNHLRYRSWRRSPCSKRRIPSPICRHRARFMRKAKTATNFCSSPRAAASANKTYLFQKTPSLLTHERDRKLRAIFIAAVYPSRLV